MAQQYLTENPEPREVKVEKIEEDANVSVSPAHPDFLVDLSPEEPLRESRAVMDEQVKPDHPAASINPPEGRGVHPTLGVDAPTPEALLSSGDAPEATGVRDGVTMTASEAEQHDES